MAYRRRPGTLAVHATEGISRPGFTRRYSQSDPGGTAPSSVVPYTAVFPYSCRVTGWLEDSPPSTASA